MICLTIVLVFLLQAIMTESCPPGSGSGAPQTNPTFTLSVAREPPWLTIGNAQGAVEYALQKALQNEAISGGQFNYKITVTLTQARQPADPNTPVSTLSPAGMPNSAFWAQYSGTVAITGTAPSGFWQRLADETIGNLLDANNVGATSMKKVSAVTISG